MKILLLLVLTLGSLQAKAADGGNGPSGPETQYNNIAKEQVLSETYARVGNCINPTILVDTGEGGTYPFAAKSQLPVASSANVATWLEDPQGNVIPGTYSVVARNLVRNIELVAAGRCSGPTSCNFQLRESTALCADKRNQIQGQINLQGRRH